MKLGRSPVLWLECQDAKLVFGSHRHIFQSLSFDICETNVLIFISFAFILGEIFQNDFIAESLSIHLPLKWNLRVFSRFGFAANVSVAFHVSVVLATAQPTTRFSLAINLNFRENEEEI